MSSIKNISASNPVPNDLAKRLGNDGIGVILATLWLPFCSQEYLPGEDKVKALESRDEALKEDIKLIYVAVTRAKSRLIISYSGEKTELLPDNVDNLYIEREIK